MPGKLVRAARERTDLRLKAERAKTDHELLRRTRESEKAGADVLRTARGRAAAVVRNARQQADGQMRARKATKAERLAADADRSQEDALLRKEHARADRVTAGERDERARLLTELLAQERRDTTQSLLLERMDTDKVITQRAEFLGLVSHDLRNELTAIAYIVAEILPNVDAGEHGRKILRSITNIQRVTLRMSRLIDDLLDVISIDVGKFTVVPHKQTSAKRWTMSLQRSHRSSTGALNR